MRLEKSIIINQPVETVFDFITDMHNAPRWTPFRDITPTSTDPIGVGATFTQTIEILGKKMETTTTVTEYEPPHVFAFKATSGPLLLENRFTLTSVDNNTQVALVAEGEPGNFARLAGPFLNSMAKKQVDSQLNALKHLLETPPA